ncbi:hypothetical protein [Bacillus toyonensis]|uniref:Cell wall anchor protein n=1 Tax=Bacillus toyonensis TaxID=155322 RepID=A0AAP8F3N0_9BACI|nr:hypothetical protein [Bacillus toyonensis]PEB89953.1 hypothetical protein CON81_27970 [Bacillus toyonensis]PHE11414.1 hypothetical protein COF62_16330 [Bacillus toyonensis]
MFKKKVIYSLTMILGITLSSGFSVPSTQAEILNKEFSNETITKSIIDKEKLNLIIKNISIEKLQKVHLINSKALSITESGGYSFDLEIAESFGYSFKQGQDVKMFFESFSSETVSKIESVKHSDLKTLLPILSSSDLISFADLLTLLIVSDLKEVAKQLISFV